MRVSGRRLVSFSSLFFHSVFSPAEVEIAGFCLRGAQKGQKDWIEGSNQGYLYGRCDMLTCVLYWYISQPAAGEKMTGQGTSIFSKDGAIGKAFNGKLFLLLPIISFLSTQSPYPFFRTSLSTGLPPCFPSADMSFSPRQQRTVGSAARRKKWAVHWTNKE